MLGQKGFTKVEVMLLTLVILFLAAIPLPNFLMARARNNPGGFLHSVVSFFSTNAGAIWLSVIGTVIVAALLLALIVVLRRRVKFTATWALILLGIAVALLSIKVNQQAIKEGEQDHALEHIGINYAVLQNKVDDKEEQNFAKGTTATEQMKAMAPLVELSQIINRQDKANGKADPSLVAKYVYIVAQSRGTGFVIPSKYATKTYSVSSGGGEPQDYTLLILYDKKFGGLTAYAHPGSLKKK